jgi:zinc metalloprotease ZmpB
VTYLVVRAIRSLGLADAVPAKTAENFAAALIAADRGSRRLPVGDGSLPGGALAKVIRWAFAQQGAYHPPGAFPCNRPGPPERVDVFVDDGRGGGYGFREDPLGAELGALSVVAADGGGRPVASARPHRVSVRVGNCGSEAARGTRVTIHAASGPGIAEWRPDGGRWTVLEPEGEAAAVRDLAAGESATFGPFRWPTRQAGEHGLLVSVSAPGDRSLIDTPLVPCGRGAPLRHLVPYDNNLLFGRWVL